MRLPGPAEHLASLRAAPTFRQVCGLAERCPDPGLPVTTKGNLRLADARRLVVELATGDDVEPAHRTLQSTTELPGLAWVVELAVAAGAVARAGGRLVTRSEFADLAEPEAYRRMVGSAIELGLSLPGTGPQVADDGLLRTSAPILLAGLLEAHAAGEPAAVEDLVAMTLELCGPAGDHPEPAGSPIVPQLERLLGLGVVRDAGPGAPGRPVADLEVLELTAAGVTTAVDLVPEVLDIEVVVRPDPATADAPTLAGALPLLDREEAEADLGTWFAAQPDPGVAAGALLAEVVAETRPAAEVLAGLDLAGAVLGEHADAAAQVHRDGPHAPLVLTWMLSRGALDPADADPHQVMVGMVTVAAAMMDVSGPEGALEFVQDADREQVLELLEQLWRVDHPRLADVLEAIGRNHPDKKVAKAARKCLMRHRSYAAR